LQFVWRIYGLITIADFDISVEYRKAIFFTRSIGLQCTCRCKNKWS